MSRKKKSKESAEIPEGFINQMETILGTEETEKLTNELKQPSPISIRINRRKIKDFNTVLDRFGTERVTQVPWCASGFYLSKRPLFVLDPLFHAGAYYVQEAASMIYEKITEDLIKGGDLKTNGKGGLKILDMCAAPGGKTTAILNGLAATGTDSYLLIANEYDSKRVRILKENLDKWGDPNVIVTNSSSNLYAELEDTFDIVAVDAPCSGEGMMRREAAARSQWSLKLIEKCSSLQKDILANAVKALKPGGILIYSTCTFNKTENEDNASWLAKQFGLNEIMHPRRFYPHRERCEGLFVTAFRKPEEEAGLREEAGTETLRRKIKAVGIKIVSDGIQQTERKGNTEIPSSRQVLSYLYDKSLFPSAELPETDAVSYLRRNTVVLPEDTPEGYVAVTFRGLPMGLVKNLGSRANNLYPSEWRILK